MLSGLAADSGPLATWSQDPSRPAGRHGRVRAGHGQDAADLAEGGKPREHVQDPLECLVGLGAQLRAAHTGRMTGKNADISARQETFKRLREVRDEALRHMRLAQQFHAERRDILRGLIAEGFSQAEIARELGVSRQAIQKMLAG